jgi:hypothetical protein
MSTESTTNKLQKINYAALGMIIGAGLALLLSELGFEMEMSVGFVLGLAIGTAIDQRKKAKHE